MAVAVYKTFIAGEVLTAADLNASLTQIVNNGQDVPFPRTESADFDGYEIILDADADSSFTVDTDDRLDLKLRGVDLFRWDGATGGTTVNGLDFIASAAGAAVQIATVGSDAAIALNLVTKSTGALQWDGTAFGTVFSRDTGTGTTNVPLVSNILGKQSIYVSAGGMYPKTTTPCSALALREITANQPEVQYLEFADGSSLNAEFSVGMPKSWDLGNLDFRVHWTSPSATGDVVWRVYALFRGDTAAIAAAYTVPNAVTDTAAGANTMLVSAYSSEFTAEGTPSSTGTLYFLVQRQGGAAGDTLAGAAQLMGVTIRYTTSALNDA